MTSKFLSKAVAAAAFGGASLLIASPGIALAGDGEHDGHRKEGWVYSWPGYTTPGGTVTIVEICKKPQENPWVWSEATGKLWLEPATDLDENGENTSDGHHDKKGKRDHKGKRDRDHKDKKDHKDRDHKDRKDKKDRDHKDKWDWKDKKDHKDRDHKDRKDKKGREHDDKKHKRFFFEENGVDEEAAFQETEELAEPEGMIRYVPMATLLDDPKRDKKDHEHADKKDKKDKKADENAVEDGAEEEAATEDEAADANGEDKKDRKNKKDRKDKKHKKHPWAYFAEAEISEEIDPGKYKLVGSCGKGELIVAPNGSVDGGFGSTTGTDTALLASGAGMVAAAALGGTVLLRRRATDGSLA